VKITIPKGVPFSLTVVASGGREYNNVILVEKILDELHKQRTIKLLIEGACPHKSRRPDVIDGGLDEIARRWAKSREVNSLSVPPKSRRIPWPGCGPARNREMAHFQPQVWVLFPGDGGTQSARDIAMEFRITRLEITEDAYSWQEHRAGAR
jgi:hypothetical protein